MRKNLAIIIISIPAIAFAAAGFADEYNDHHHWIYPAYAYCLGFGVAFLLGLFAVSLIWESKSKNITRRISDYMKRHPVAAIIFSGVLVAIPLGIIGSVSWEVIWFLSILPFLCLTFVFPIILTVRKVREKWLLAPLVIKWSLIISISSIAASLLFIILTNYDLLPGTDITYFARPNRSHHTFYSPTHPYDSMIEIWSMPMFFICETFFAIILHWVGLRISAVNERLCKKLSDKRHRKRAECNDIYIEE